MSKQTDSKKEYDKEYRRTKMVAMTFRLNKIRDAELIQTYNSIPNKMEWFKRCLEEYRQREGQ